jgi:hypothetical protein
MDRKLKTAKTQGRDLNTYSEDAGGGTPLWGRYSARLFRPESELCQTIATERPGIKVPIMSGGLQELEHVYMKGPFLPKPFTGTALRQFIKALLSPNPPLRTP